MFINNVFKFNFDAYGFLNAIYYCLLMVASERVAFFHCRNEVCGLDTETKKSLRGCMQRMCYEAIEHVKYEL